MKLSIYGGRLSFYQWDTGQRLIVDGADMCEEVHFVTRTLNGALVVRIENQDGLRVANVPNLLLQSAYPITAYVYYRNADNRETRYARVFGVKSREKPSDYVYTETEVLTYKKLEEKLDQMQGLIGDLTDLKTESKDNLVDAINKTIYTLPPMTGTALGGAMADPAQKSDTQPVRIGADHKLYTAPGGSASSPDVLYVNLTMGEGGTITADKTFAEITEAAGSGMCVIARFSSGEMFYLTFYGGTFVKFSQSNGIEFVNIYCNSSDTWEVDPYILNASDVGAIPSPSTAAVGQTIVVKAVDISGFPTEWKSADLPTGGGGSGKAKSQMLINQQITELTASLSVTLEHDFHNLTAIISCGSDGVALTVGSDGTAVASKIGLMVDTTSFDWNARKVAYTDTSTGKWNTKMFSAEWSNDLSVFKRCFTTEIVTGISNKAYFSPFGGTDAMYGTLVTDDNAPRTGKTANIVVKDAYLNVGTRVVLWGEYYE